MNLKERLRSHLSNEEITKLEYEEPSDNFDQQQSQNTNSFIKLPIFQPTAAAAMMYNMQNVSLQQRKIKKQDVEFKSTNQQQQKQSGNSSFLAINLEDDESENKTNNKNQQQKVNLKSKLLFVFFFWKQSNFDPSNYSKNLELSSMVAFKRIIFKYSY